MPPGGSSIITITIIVIIIIITITIITITIITITIITITIIIITISTITITITTIIIIIIDRLSQKLVASSSSLITYYLEFMQFLIQMLICKMTLQKESSTQGGPTGKIP